MRCDSLSSKAIVTAIFVFIAIPLACAVNVKQKPDQEKNVTSLEIVNKRMYSDDQNTSFINQSRRIKGEPVWERTIDVQEMSPPVHLAIFDSNLVVRYPSVLEVWDKQKGRGIWRSDVMPNADVEIKQQGVVTLNHAGMYELLGMDKKIASSYLLPFLSAETILKYSRQEGNLFKYVYQSLPIPTSDPEDEYSGSVITFNRYDNSTENLEWEFEKEGVVVAVLESRKYEQYAICAQDNLYLFAVNNAADSGVTNIPFEDILSCSVDLQDQLLVVGRQKDDKEYFFKIFSFTGKQLSQFPLTKTGISTQPPVIAPDGSVYFVVKNSLHNFKNGQLHWKSDVKASGAGVYITVLADSSLLIGAGMTLLHYSPDGKVMTKVALKDNVTTRPVMDSNGMVYIGYKNGIAAIQ